MNKQKSWVDYKAIKNSVTMQMALDRYGVTLKKSGENHTSCCPIHKGSHDTQFSVNMEKNIWRCFGACDVGGNVLDFTAMMEFGDKKPASIHKAALKLRDWFLDGEPGDPDTPVETTDADENKATEADPEADEQPPENSKKPTNKPLTF